MNTHGGPEISGTFLRFQNSIREGYEISGGSLRFQRVLPRSQRESSEVSRRFQGGI